MSGDAPERLNEALQRQRALSRWENEGGAVPSSSPAAIHGAGCRGWIASFPQQPTISRNARRREFLPALPVFF